MIEEHEKYSKKAELRKVKNSLQVAILAVNTKEDGTSPESHSQLQASGKKILDYLADPESLIHKIYPHILEEHGDIIEKAREKFPEPESRDYILTIFNAYSRL